MPSTPVPEALDAEALGLTFPCIFAIKAMGRDRDNFLELVLEIIGEFVPVDKAIVKQRPSNNGKYLSVTVSIEAQDKEQLDNIYIALNGHERVLMTL